MRTKSSPSTRCPVVRRPHCSRSPRYPSSSRALSFGQPYTFCPFCNQYNDRKVSPPRPPETSLANRNMNRDMTSHRHSLRRTQLLRPYTHRHRSPALHREMWTSATTVWKTYTFGSEAAMTTQLAACEPWAGAHAEPALRPGVATCGQACATMRTRTGRATAGLRS